MTGNQQNRLAFTGQLWLDNLEILGPSPKRNMLFDKIYYLYIRKKETWGNSVVCRMDRFLFKTEHVNIRVATQGLHSNRVSLDLLCFV